jgi:hypothetical protein
MANSPMKTRAIDLDLVETFYEAGFIPAFLFEE